MDNSTVISHKIDTCLRALRVQDTVRQFNSFVGGVVGEIRWISTWTTALSLCRGATNAGTDTNTSANANTNADIDPDTLPPLCNTDVLVPF